MLPLSPTPHSTPEGTLAHSQQINTHLRLLPDCRIGSSAIRLAAFRSASEFRRRSPGAEASVEGALARDWDRCFGTTAAAPSHTTPDHTPLSDERRIGSLKRSSIWGTRGQGHFHTRSACPPQQPHTAQQGWRGSDHALAVANLTQHNRCSSNQSR